MPYADLAPADIERKLAGHRPTAHRRRPAADMARTKRAKRSPVCPSQADIWPGLRIGDNLARALPGERAIDVAHRSADRRRQVVASAFAALGAALRDGLLDETPRRREPTPAERLLDAIDRARDVRAVVGRIDVSGGSDAACWACLTPRGEESLLSITYRFGRDVLADLKPVIERLVVAEGWSLNVFSRRLDRARQHGGSAFVLELGLRPRPPVTSARKAAPAAPQKKKIRARAGTKSAPSGRARKLAA